MNGKMKVLIALVSIVGISAMALYAVPIMAYQNGTLDQERMKDYTCSRERDRECLCLQNETCTCQNADCPQNGYRHQFQQEECIEHRNSSPMGMGMANNNCFRNQEVYRMRL